MEFGFGKIKIISCHGSSMWYENKVGQILPLVRRASFTSDVYWCQEDAGFLNIVKKIDAEIVDEKEN